MTKKKISLCYKILVILSLLIGIIINLKNTASVISILSYYTLQSNILCLIAFIYYLVHEIRKKEYKNDIYYLIKGAIVIAIIITALVYRIALAPTGFEMASLEKAVNNNQIADFFVHTLSPILVVLDYFIFDEKGRFKGYYPIIWLVIPLNYILYVYTYSNHGGRFYSIGGSRKFAYFFLDYNAIGYMGVFKWIMLFSIFILMISYLLVVFDYIMGMEKESL